MQQEMTSDGMFVANPKDVRSVDIEFQYSPVFADTGKLSKIVALRMYQFDQLVANLTKADNNTITSCEECLE